MWFLYVAECCDGSLYTGITTDIKRRIHEHNHTRRGAKYTRSRRPVQLLGYICCKSRSDALKKEFSFKRLSKKQKLKKVQMFKKL